MSQITTLVKTHNLTDAVDFVTGGRIHLLVTQKEIEEARADYRRLSEETRTRHMPSGFKHWEAGELCGSPERRAHQAESEKRGSNAGIYRPLRSAWDA